MSQDLLEAADWVRSATRIAVLTGAGVSAESGVPTFRDALTGLWSRFRPEELATPEAYRADPALVWDWYRWRRELVDQAQPNAAHVALARLGRSRDGVTVVTQNVDGLHQRAGQPRLITLHGDLHHARCERDGATREWTLDERFPPLCTTCGGRMRPDIVWFGESLPRAAWDAAEHAALTCDVFLSIGTSNMVQPAASLPWLAAEHGARVIVVNPSREGQRNGPRITVLEGRAGDLVPRLVEPACERLA